ncbi:hypothetical protein ACFWDQ_40910 [Streptomyces sp. NPDC060053]|uniref:hypothetical protein n=1 Tax=Streptomyces sp. NPDC060053 TaxID=3347047 RepID=UPI0036957512
MSGEFSHYYALLDETDWSQLDHGGGPADPGTPAKLAGLVSGDSDAVTIALNHLWNDLLHQGSLYSATPAAARCVAVVLGDPHTRECLTASHRIQLLEWIAELAYAVSISRERQLEAWFGPGIMTRSSLFSEVRMIRPLLFRRVNKNLSDSDKSVVEAALLASIHLLEDPELTSLRREIAPKVKSILAASSIRSYRDVAISGLEAWGENVESLKRSTEGPLMEYQDSSIDYINDPPF